MKRLKRMTRRATRICVFLMALYAPSGLLKAQALTIAEPQDGTIVNPGQVVTVVVDASPPLAFREIIVFLGEIGVSQTLVAPPFRFSLTVPPHARPRRYNLTADGFTEPGKRAASDPVGILVERPDNPVSLSAEPTIMHLRLAGDESSMRVLGTFPDGAVVDVHESTYVIYESDRPRIATVDAYGLVTAVAPGSANIVVRYKDKSTVVPVIVSKNPAEK